MGKKTLSFQAIKEAYKGDLPKKASFWVMHIRQQGVFMTEEYEIDYISWLS